MPMIDPMGRVGMLLAKMDASDLGSVVEVLILEVLSDGMVETHGYLADQISLTPLPDIPCSVDLS